MNPLTRNQFLAELERNGISLDESRLHEVNYSVSYTHLRAHET